MWVDKNESQQFFDILRTESITPVYQPIVSLSDGEIYGYEALSRIINPEYRLSIDRLFSLATQIGQSSPLECLCRERSIKEAGRKPRGSKLFLNVDANLIYEPDFIDGFTDDKLSSYGLTPEDIVFEITERSAVEDVESFEKAIDKYQQMGFHIAIDDVGAGYSGMNRIHSTLPQYLKIDMSIIRNIHLDAFKISMVNSMCNFCQEMGIYLIAEGIETEDELRQIMKLGIPYGQGYFFRRPASEFESLESEKRELLIRMKEETASRSCIYSLFGCVEAITEAGNLISPDSRILDALDRFKSDSSIMEICVVDEDGKFHGVLLRNTILEAFAGRYDFSINQRKTAKELMKTDSLIVDASASIEAVSKTAMARADTETYDAVVVTKDNKYLGIATVKALLTTAINIQLRRAMDINPLTELPGNMLIEEMILKSISNPEPFALIYIDIDNFKAFNDSYGFSCGDRMIQALADTIRQCFKESNFIGHIGGDDFVIITNTTDVKPQCQELIDCFRNRIKQIYSEVDWDRGYIITRNRNGITERFPIATLSIAIVTSEAYQFEDINSITREVAETKKRAKEILGNSIVVA
ncbi:MAG: GGDEF domain-containing protein [Clostridiales bacterium]|nr:GGDEF domain-containing protein [Clostridiales bacterium]